MKNGAEGDDGSWDPNGLAQQTAKIAFGQCSNGPQEAIVPVRIYAGLVNANRQKKHGSLKPVLDSFNQAYRVTVHDVSCRL